MLNIYTVLRIDELEGTAQEVPVQEQSFDKDKFAKDLSEAINTVFKS